MHEGTRRRILLTVLGVLLLSVAVRYLRPAPETGGERIADRAATAGSGERASPKRSSGVATLRTANLERVPPGATAGRDPWRFMEPPAPQRRSEPTIKPPAPTPQRSPAPGAQLPELAMEYLGNFGPQEKRIAVFSDGKQIYNALEGDVIGQQFVVARIGHESVDLRYVGFPDLPAKRLGVRRR
jgi:hypothetical protein